MVASGMGAAVVEPSLTAGLAKLSTNPNFVGSLMAPRAPTTSAPGFALPSVFAGLLGKKKDDAQAGGPPPLVASPPAAGGESDADLIKRFGLSPEPTAPVATAPASSVPAPTGVPENDADVMKRLDLQPEP